MVQSGPNFVYTKSVFEWDPRKAQANAAKHGVWFEDAVTVFLDPEALDGPDLQHSSAESRFLRLGRSGERTVLMVASTFRRSGDAEAIRMISARRASRRERAASTATDRFLGHSRFIGGAAEIGAARRSPSAWR